MKDELSYNIKRRSGIKLNYHSLDVSKMACEVNLMVMNQITISVHKYLIVRLMSRLQ